MNLNFVGYWLSSRLQLQIMVFLDEYIDEKKSHSHVGDILL